MIKKMKRILKIGLSLIAFYSAIIFGGKAYNLFMYDYKGSSVVYMLAKGGGGGTGFQVIAPSGHQYTLTNKHICTGQGTFMKYKDQKGVTGLLQILKISELHDLCILEPIPRLPALKIASSLEMHDEVNLLGHPNLRPLTWEKGFFIGNSNINVAYRCRYVSKHARVMKHQLLQMMGVCVVNLSANAFNTNSYPGNSGSPIVNSYGNLVSVLFAGNPRQPDISYAVPLEDINEFIKNF